MVWLEEYRLGTMSPVDARVLGRKGGAIMLGDS